jgi:hypothetical protein
MLSVYKLLILYKDHENIIAITGQAGTVSPFGQRVVSLSFVTFNSDTGAIKQYGVSRSIESRVMTQFLTTRLALWKFRGASIGVVPRDGKRVICCFWWYRR